VSRHRSRAFERGVIGLSVSYQHDDLLSRGIGLEHLKELLHALARPLLRQGASLAYGGNWEETEYNLTYELLRLVKAEQDNNAGTDADGRQIGKLFNHLSWPRYLSLSTSDEARWIDSCRVVRITQAAAGIVEAAVVPDDEAYRDDPRTVLNTALALSAMRRLMMEEMQIEIPDVPQAERIPPVVARIMMSGRVTDYSGFLPGIFEEALATLEQNKPLYLLGGFGGAAECLARAMLGDDDELAKFTLEWQEQHTPALGALRKSAQRFGVPAGFVDTQAGLERLRTMVLSARADLAGILQTGLSTGETKELLTTCSINDAARLVRNGLAIKKHLPDLPA
jgi:hypothetical protein